MRIEIDHESRLIGRLFHAQDFHCHAQQKSFQHSSAKRCGKIWMYLRK